jgi:chromosome segregation ATPase
MKLREVEEQLDPVTNIVTKLMKEVEASRVSVKKHTQETQVELEALKHEATELKTSVAKTGEAQLAAQHALEEVDRHARALSERLELESSRTAALGAQGDTASETLKDYAHSLGDLQAQLKSTSDQATANVKALSESVKKANEQVSDLQKTLAGMQASPAPASLAKLDSAAKDLTQSLDRASARMKTAEGSLPPVEKKAGRAPETLTSHLATTSTTATPSKPPP